MKSEAIDNGNGFLRVGRSLLFNRDLILQLVKRDIRGRYSGSVLGLAWPVLIPLIMLGMYTFVFGIVFKARWQPVATAGADGGVAGFALALFAGLIVHGFFTEVISRSPGMIVGNVNFVKRVVFPLESLAWVAVLAAAFHAVLALAVYAIGILVVNGSVPPTIVFAPLVLLACAPLAAAFAWIISSTGVFFRDLAQIVGLLSAALLFLSPVFYPLSSVPAGMQSLIWLNPLTFPIEQLRAVAVAGSAPDWLGLLLYLIVAWACASFCLWWFQRTRHGFADVL